MKLLVITEELPSEFPSSGHDAGAMGRYYDPCGMFGEVALIDWGTGDDWPELPHRVLELQPDKQFNSWLQSVQMLDRHSVVTESQLFTGFPGVPETWLKTIREFKPDIIRCYGARWSAVLAVTLKEKLGIKLLCSVHNISENSLNLPNRADAVMAVTEAVATELSGNCGIAPEKITVVPNRVDLEKFTPETQPADGPVGSPRILTVARDVEQKNLNRLLSACQQLQKEYPELSLVHIGISQRDWSSYAFATHIESVDNAQLASWYAWADMFALPSLWEGFGIVLIESLACGCPVMTSNIAPMSTIISEDETGATADPKDVAAMVDALKKLIGQKVNMSTLCRESVQEYSVGAVEAREKALYEIVIGDNSPCRVENGLFPEDYGQLVYLAGAQKTNGLFWHSLLTSLKMLTRAPFRLAGYKALFRTLVPLSLLQIKRGVRSVL